MALSSILSEPCDGTLILRDSSGKPLAPTIDVNLFSITGILEDKPVTTPNLDVPPAR